jgi:chemotaxis signal transduction protein
MDTPAPAMQTDVPPMPAADDSGLSAADAHARQRMLLRIGELGVLIPWDGGREVAPVPPASRVPNTPAWLRGLANVRGALVPVVDVAAAFGLGRAGARGDYLLICGQGEAAIGLLIDGLPRTFDIDAAAAVADNAAPDTALAACVRARYRHAEGVALDMDLQSLFDALGQRLTRS